MSRCCTMNFSVFMVPCSKTAFQQKVYQMKRKRQLHSVDAALFIKQTGTQSTPSLLRSSHIHGYNQCYWSFIHCSHAFVAFLSCSQPFQCSVCVRWFTTRTSVAPGSLIEKEACIRFICTFSIVIVSTTLEIPFNMHTKPLTYNLLISGNLPCNPAHQEKAKK